MKIYEENLIKVIDFWNSSVKREKLYNREVIENIDYKSKEVIDIIGPRRSGKSSVLKLVINRLGIKDAFLYINFEDPYFIKNNSPEIIENLIEVFKENYSNKLKYLFFDEIQEIENWEKAIRKLRDVGEYKIFVTGSSSKLLSQEISSVLTGRHLTHKVFPLNFREFLFFENISVDSKKDIVLKKNLILKKFGEHLNFGGFPEVVITKNKELLKNYFYDILQKDIVMRYEIRDKDALEKMAVFFLTNSGKIISMESIKDAFNLSYYSVDLYMEYLKNAFLVFELPQFSFSLKKQAKAMKKIYAVDTGLANAISFKFSEDKGRMLENLVYLNLIQKDNDVYYYRTKNYKEVDFFTRENNKAKELIQVVWDLSNPEAKEREIDNLFEAMKEAKLSNGCILTFNEEDLIKKTGKTINVLPVYKWILGY